MGYDLGFGLLIVSMLLSLPAAWFHYEAILILPLAMLLVYSRDKRGIDFKIVVPLALAFGLLCFGNLWSVYDKQVLGRFWQLVLSYKVYGMALLWLGLALLLVRRPARTPEEPASSP